jgi:tRNA modification GTPase
VDADLVLWLDDVAPPAEAGAKRLWINARCDLPGRIGSEGRISVSARTGAGLEALWAAIERLSADLLPLPDAIALNARQRNLAGRAATHLIAASVEADPLLQAEHLRGALRQFDRITGAADVEAMLDALFGQFCIGK